MGRCIEVFIGLYYSQRGKPIRKVVNNAPQIFYVGRKCVNVALQIFYVVHLCFTLLACI